MKKSFLSIIFLFVTGLSFTQFNIDSLVTELSAAKEDTHRAAILSELASRHYNLGNDFLAVEYANKCKKIADKYTLLEERVTTRIIIGTIYAYWGLPDQSMDLLNEALELNKELGNNNLYSMALTSLAFLFEELGEYGISITYTKEALVLDRKDEQWENLTIGYINIGSTFLSVNLDSSLYYLKKAHVLSTQYNLDYLKPTILNEMGNYYKKKGINYEALLYYVKAKSHPYFKEDIMLQAKVHANLANIYMDIDRFDRARSALNDLKHLPDSNLYIENKHLYYETQFKFDSLQGNYLNALSIMQQLNNMNEQTYSEDFRSRMANFESIYETDKKVVQIKTLQEQQEIIHSKMRLQRWLIFTLLFIATLIGVLLTYVNGNRKRQAKFNKRLIHANSEMREANINKDKFISILSHDLKNPFHAVLGLSQSLNENFDFLGTEEKKEIAGYINESAQKIYTLLEDLLEWSRSQNHQIKPSYENLNLAEITRSSLEYLQPLFQRKEIKLIEEIPAEININADKHMLFTIIRNLVSNAIKYCPQGGKVELNANELENYVQYSVRDNGIGMSSLTMEKLFQQDRSFSTDGTYFEKGSGFGLIISKEFITTMGGEIQVTSELGRGSVFSFTISKNLI